MALNRKLAIALLSDVGRVRRNNEDAVDADPELGLLLLADGMGGYNAGEVASRLAVSTALSVVRGPWPPPRPDDRAGQNESWSPAARVLRQALEAAHQAIREAARNPQYAGMGTTAVACLLHGDSIAIAHVGDSRLYRLRNDRLEQLTRDHSLIEELITRRQYTREEAGQQVGRNIVTRALGADVGVQVDVQEQNLAIGDLILLCSDGLTDMLDDERIRLTLVEFAANLPQAARSLIDQANAGGGRDNISVALARVDAAPAPQRPWYQRVAKRQ